MDQSLHEKNLVTISCISGVFWWCMGTCVGVGAFAGAYLSLSSTCTAAVVIFDVSDTVCSIAGSAV